MSYNAYKVSEQGLKQLITHYQRIITVYNEFWAHVNSSERIVLFSAKRTTLGQIKEKNNLLVKRTILFPEKNCSFRSGTGKEQF